ncbi:hypothetical protein LSH36_595g00023 [Paralvinella palmiformis]|uniref:CCR4-NOT transcription complex subunit 10 n=1 Tax=Paralvinella palmiformis TaxID=53620 RepID=A0AAD9MWE2_9ANNE|nr:hypothetical protein LSH36_595g00023 [Paralvinella palmiformis]
MADSKGEELENASEQTGKLPAATEMERELAHQAAKEFESRHFDQCLALLSQLTNSRGQDSKVIHNRGVVEYYRSDMAKTDEFKKALQEISHKSRFNLENITNLEDVDQCIVYYNQAVILYHLRQYSKSFNILDKLCPLIEPMDEILSRKVLFLLVELHLCTKRPEKAMGVISMIEKVLYGNGKTTQQDKDGNSKDLAETTTNSNNDIYRIKITQYKVRCCMMSKYLKLCKRELKGLMTALGQQPSIPVTYLKANFEYLRNNFRKAMKFLNSMPPSAKLMATSGESLPVMFYNNLGVIHLHLRKHHLGAFYLRKAIHENGLAAKEYNTVDPTKTLSGRPIYTIAVSRHYELLYNMGVQLLHCGKPTAAFDCLIQSLEQCQINPRLWLRLAECCIMVYRENNLEDRRLSKRLQVIQGSEGSGIHRKLILGSGLRHETLCSESAVIPAPTLEFGSLCLRNALMLLPEDPVLRKSPKRNSDTEQPDIKHPHDNVLIPAPPGNPMRPSEVSNLRCSILAAIAYVSLCLNDYQVALQHAEQLLKQPRLSGAHSQFDSQIGGVSHNGLIATTICSRVSCWVPSGYIIGCIWLGIRQEAGFVSGAWVGMMIFALTWLGIFLLMIPVGYVAGMLLCCGEEEDKT